MVSGWRSVVSDQWSVVGVRVGSQRSAVNSKWALVTDQWSEANSPIYSENIGCFSSGQWSVVCLLFTTAIHCITVTGVVVITRTWCPYCHESRDTLSSTGSTGNVS